MSPGGSVSFEVISVDRSGLPVDAPVHKASDGSVCLFTVSQCDDPNATLEVCSICSCPYVGERYAPCGLSPIPILQGSQFQLCLGQAPDLSHAALISPSPAPLAQHSFFRSLLENALRGSRPHELIRVRYARDKSSPEIENTPIFSLELKIDQVIQPPLCTKHHALPSTRCVDEGTSAFAGDAKDPLENPTNDWNPELATHWFRRAWALKERGTWLVQHHTAKRRTTDDSSNRADTESQVLANRVWQVAFACYSRGLQLATLARSAREICASETGETAVVARTLATTQPTPGLADADQLTDAVKGTVDVSTGSVARLEFSLLLNLALCQLKAGLAEFAVHNCTQALKLEPGWVEAVRDQTVQTGRIQDLMRDQLALSHSDVAKALYRRAQAYLRIGKAEEAKMDAEAAIRLQKLSTADQSAATTNINNNGAISAAIAASEALLAQAVERISRDDAILVERLRKRRNQL